MYVPKWSWLPLVVVLLLFSIAALLAGCDLAQVQPTSTPAVPTDTPPPARPTNAATGETPPVPSVITLTMWTTEAFSPTQTVTQGRVLAQQVAAFEASRPDVRIQFVLKKPYGKGGILDYLLTTSAVVPELLPDLVIMDVDELDAAVEGGLAQPLDDLIPPDLVGDLYAFARQAGSFDGRLYGLQYWADLDHLVYNTGRMTVHPSSWPGVLSNPGPYLFPAGGQAGLVNDDFLIQYLAVRGLPGEGEPFLDEGSLAAVLQFYQDGTSQGIFPPEILELQSTDDSWRDYLDGNAALSHVSTHGYLMERDLALNSAAAPIPAINGPGASIGRGWAIALVTSDPARQSLAAEFLSQLMSPETSAAWNQAANYAPTRQAALALWDQTDGYTRFLQQLLTAAQPRPALTNYTQVAAALQEAVEDVLSGAAAPEEAAAEAVEKVQ